MIKISLLLISIFSLLYGLVFSFAPFFFAELTQAEPTNIAWLRNIGASICGVLFLGLLFVYRSPSKNYDLFMIITITSILQTLGLIYSRFYNEFSAQNSIIIDFTIYSAIFVSLYLVYILLNYNSIFNK
ncbi:hypothetical protein N8080_03565 [Alphaproteobacteria bacterium]|nr:hypothetical protein [Alphaproteobacteria bacterium]